MKGIIIVFVVLISVTNGIEYCDVAKKKGDVCVNNGKCTDPTCVEEATLSTTLAPGGATTPTTPTAAANTPAAAANTPTAAANTPTAATNATTTHARKRRDSPTVAVCSTGCPKKGEVCRYQCTGQSGSIKHGLAPLALLVGVLTKLFVVG